MRQLVDLQTTGFGLTLTVLLDATIIRSVLVPASMALFGNANWYLPRWLERLPDIRIEDGASGAGSAPATSAVEGPAAGQ
ncbi:MAG TPA: hypothetical protein VMR52_05615 [Dehalococcoidia bacterium]|nr:hypothetical protein [Dehalococcoidia bacterium]